MDSTVHSRQPAMTCVTDVGANVLAATRFPAPMPAQRVLMQQS